MSKEGSHAHSVLSAPIRGVGFQGEPMARRTSRIYHRSVVQGGGVGVGRSTAIVLFTDLVGSTGLRSQLGEYEAEVLRQQHDALVTGAIEAGRGTVVKNLGDGIMATFT